MNKLVKASVGIVGSILVLAVIGASLPNSAQLSSETSAISSASVAVQQASSSAIYVMSSFCNATQNYIASINADPTMTPQQKATDIANATANWNAEYQEFKSAGVTYNCNLSATASTAATTSTSSVTTLSSTAPYLYFSVSCGGCTTRGQPSEYVGLWNSSWTTSQYAGYYEFYTQGSENIAAAPLYGNGTMIFRVGIGPNEVLHDWQFERMTSDGTLQVSLLRSNGTLVWQGSATGANYTVTSPGFNANVTL